MEHFKNYIGGIKDRIVGKIREREGRIAGAMKKTAEYTKEASLAVLSADDLANKAAESGIRYSKQKYEAAKQRVTDIKNYVIEGIGAGVTKVREGAEDVADFGRLSVARATERISDPLIKLQVKALRKRFEHLAARVDKKNLPLIQRKLALLDELLAPPKFG